MTAKDVITATLGHEIGHITKNNARLLDESIKHPGNRAANAD